MEPRSEDRGDLRWRLEVVETHAAMEPRSEDRGDGKGADKCRDEARAAMEPRSEDRGDWASARPCGKPSTRRNVAAVRGPR